MVVDLQKAGLWKRFAAWLLDIMVISVLAVGVGVLLSSILNYDSYFQQYDVKYNYYVEKYQLDEIDFEAALTQEEIDRVNTADREMAGDTEAVRLYNILINMSLLIITFSLLLGTLIPEFFIPLLLKNGQTLGKKAFSLGLIRTDGVKMNNMQLFARTVLGKFTIETMIPAYILLMIFFGEMGMFGWLFLGALLIVQLVCMGVTRTNSAIHDLIAGTVVVDISSQQIFKSTNELIAYTKRIHAEQAARKEY